MLATTPPTRLRCHSTHIVKNRNIHNGKQTFKCRKCARQFV
ncbi:IS1/IS1595 family N-terminal zinc-binding domain-containing protein [Parathermosynechococcus lividus]